MKTQTTAFILSEIRRISDAYKPGGRPVRDYEADWETLLARAEELADRVANGKERAPRDG